MKNALRRLATVLLLAPALAASRAPQPDPAPAAAELQQCGTGQLRRGTGCVRLRDATDAEVRDHLVRESIRDYPGNCPCPYNTDRAGRRCGGRSAYSRPGGHAPLCYRTDVSAEAVRQARAGG